MTRSISLSPDDRVELLLPGQLGQVAAELVEDERARGRGLGGGAGGGRLLLAGVAGEELDDLLADRDRSAPSFTSTWAATPSPPG